MPTLISSGTEFADHPAQRRGIELSNQISLGLFCLLILLTGLYVGWFGWFFIAKALPVAGMLSLVTLLLNRTGFLNVSRIWLCLFMSVTATAISIYSKIQYY